jgi:hypothetical protein
MTCRSKDRRQIGHGRQDNARVRRKYSEIVWLRAARTASTRHDAMVITGLPNTYRSLDEIPAEVERWLQDCRDYDADPGGWTQHARNRAMRGLVSF